MKNIGIIIVCLTLAIFTLNSCSGQKNKKVTYQNQTVKTNMELSGLGDINYSFSELSSDLDNYLREKSDYRTQYKDKKLVIYYVGADCPYAQAFIDAVNPLINDGTNYTTDYDFYAESVSGSKSFESMDDAQKDVDFHNLCHEFCVVNPTKKQIFSIDGIGYNEAKKIKDILDQLKSW